jgi:hypothetical protein
MLDFQKLITETKASTPQELFNSFKNKLWELWASEYARESNDLYGDITCQGFWGGFQFVIDLTDLDPRDGLPETRVVVAFGVSTTPAIQKNRDTMKTYWRHVPLLFERYGAQYNKGHFIAHSMGGPIDVNLFPQIAHINLGRSERGKNFRKMEKYAAGNPGTFVFARPVYGDLTDCPVSLEYGYCDTSMKPVLEIFPNRP